MKLVEKKQWLNVIVPILSLFAVLYITFSSGHIADIKDAFSEIEMSYIISCVVVVVISWLIEAWILYDISGGDLSVKRSITIVVAGLFFNAITPFSSGGQPAQLYMMHQDKISYGKGSSILARKFIIFQTILVLYGLMVVVFYAPFFFGEIPRFAYMSIVGFSVNIIVIVGLYLISFRYKTTRKLLMNFVLRVRKWTKNKRIRAMGANFMGGVREFHDQMKLSTTSTKWVRLGILTFLQLSLFFLVPVIISLGLGLTQIQFLKMISASAFVAMATAFIPLPGAAFGAEGGFYVFFNLFYPSNLILTALILWRLLTFYFPMVAGMVVVMLASRKKATEEAEDDKTKEMNTKENEK